jgi:hypothetical protein
MVPRVQGLRQAAAITNFYLPGNCKIVRLLFRMDAVRDACAGAEDVWRTRVPEVWLLEDLAATTGRGSRMGDSPLCQGLVRPPGLNSSVKSLQYAV